MKNNNNMNIKDEMSIKLKRGLDTWSYFPLAYNILLTITIGLIAVLPNDLIDWRFKLILIILFSVFYIDICFYNDWFRNWIVGFFTKSLEHVETRHAK